MTCDVEVRRGITRTVLLVGRWAVKVPSLRAHGDGLAGVLWSFTRGVQANLSERGWSGSPGACPVLWSAAGLLSVYPRCAPVDPDHEIDWAAIGFFGPVDRKHPNVGWYRGRIVLVDYDMSWNDCPHGVSVGEDDVAAPHRCRRVVELEAELAAVPRLVPVDESEDHW